METKVLTPKGFKLLGDVQVGDAVCNPDGTVARIIAVRDWGEQQFYRVTLADGSAVEASEGHLWVVSLAGLRKRRKKKPGIIPTGLRPEDEWNLRVAQRCTLVTTAELSRLVGRATDDGARQKRCRYVQLPLTAPVMLTRAKGRWPVMPPYTLGVLVGDGLLRDEAVTFCGEDEGIAEAVQSELGAALHVNFVEVHNHCPTYRISGRRGQKKDSPQELLRRDGLLGTYSYDKFIPQRILWAPPDVRFAFARGLFDTDGHMDKRGHVELTTVSERLAGDLQRLLRSLGYRAKITTKQPTYTYKGEKRNGRLAYRLHVRGPHQDLLFALPRKAERVRQFNGGDVWPSHRVISVEASGRDNARCITVDHPNGLYVTDDFIVTHNSSLLLGLACTKHLRSVIIRREAKQGRGMIDYARETFGSLGRFNENTGVWRGLPGGRQIEFDGLKNPGDEKKQKGRGKDFLGFDEADDLPENVVRFVMGWLRSVVPGQRCRAVLTFNPPHSAEGRWLLSYFGPWVDRKHPRPALPGELRWYAHLPDGAEKEMPDGTPFEVTGPDGKVRLIRPLSRTFIPAKLDDNAYLAGTDYFAQLNAMHEPLRSQLLYGDMEAGLEDAPMQAIPTAWVQAAQARWQTMHAAQPGPPENQPLSCLGVDVARGGRDKTVIAARHGSWFAPLRKYAGKATDDGPKVAALVLEAMGEAKAFINVDVIGVGASVYDFLKGMGPAARVRPINNAEASETMDKSGRFRLTNVRAASYWKLREALDPIHGDSLALPPDPELLADLCAPCYEVTAAGIKIERKTDVADRIGRSPDVGDAVVLAHYLSGKAKLWVSV